MASPKPILVIQMQRMGDLVLSFPLMLWLERTFPGHPVWVMAESRFAAPLVRVSPTVRYLGFDRHGQVEREKFFLVINLSHRSGEFGTSWPADWTPKPCRRLHPRRRDPYRRNVAGIPGFVDPQQPPQQFPLGGSERSGRHPAADHGRHALACTSDHAAGPAYDWPFFGASESDKRPSAGFGPA